MSRIVLKISGEVLKKDNDLVAEDNLKKILKLINILKNDHQLAIVVGGGNIFRGRENIHMDEVSRDSIGIMGTIINAIYIKEYLSRNGIDSYVKTPFSFPDLIDYLSDDELLERFNSGWVICFGGGLGKSGYSTDSGTIYASELLKCDLIIKLTKVDGIYEVLDNEKVRYFDKITFDEVLDKKLAVMDEYAIKKCKENNTKILVMNFNDYDKLDDYFKGYKIGTEVVNEKR